MEIVTVLSMLSSPPRAFVCGNGHPTVQAEFSKSLGVFVGTVTAAQGVQGAKDFYEGTKYTVRVNELLRGKLGPTVQIFSENTSGRFPMGCSPSTCCSSTATLGERWSTTAAIQVY